MNKVYVCRGWEDETPFEGEDIIMVIAKNRDEAGGLVAQELCMNGVQKFYPLDFDLVELDLNEPSAMTFSPGAYFGRK